MDASKDLSWFTHGITARGELVMAIKPCDPHATCVVLTVDASRLMTAVLHGLANTPDVDWPNARQAVLATFLANPTCHQATVGLPADAH